MTQLRRQRISHGERTRMEILDIAEGLATREGLEGLTISRLANEVGMSKGGVYAHFGSKEALQLATFSAALERYQREVGAPALQEPPGLARLQAAFENYFTYAKKRLQSGGCFFTASTLEMADRTGPVRDRVTEFIRGRQALIAQTLRDAIRRKEIARDVDPEQLAFELASLATGAMVELQLFKSDKTLERVRAAIKARLAAIAI